VDADRVAAKLVKVRDKKTKFLTSGSPELELLLIEVAGSTLLTLSNYANANEGYIDDPCTEGSDVVE
jgi:hypothetical protein